MGLKRLFIACLLVAGCFTSLLAQNDSSRVIKVHFLYGSKPHPKHKDKETKWFGGLHGGHVSIEVDNEIVGFVPSGKLHIFARRNKKKLHSGFSQQDLEWFRQDTVSCKYATVHIPVSKEQYEKIRSIHSSYTKSSPYDYAFFGMRCAAATYEILGQLDVVKDKSVCGNILSHFYPKPLRRKVFKLAKKKDWVVTSQPGRKTRIWEKD